MIALKLVVVTVTVLLLVGTATAEVWVVIQPNIYVGQPGVWGRLWHALQREGDWVVIAVYRNADACLDHKETLTTSALAERKAAKRWGRRELDLNDKSLQTRCLPLGLAEKVGTLQVPDWAWIQTR